MCNIDVYDKVVQFANYSDGSISHGGTNVNRAVAKYTKMDFEGVH